MTPGRWSQPKVHPDRQMVGRGYSVVQVDGPTGRHGLEVRAGEDHVQRATRPLGRIRGPILGHSSPAVGDRLVRRAIRELVEVAGHDRPRTDVSGKVSGMRRTFGSTQAEVDTDHGERLSARERHSNRGIPPRPIREPHPKPPRGGRVDPRAQGREDGRAPTAQPSTRPEQPALTGKCGQAELGGQATRHLLKTEHVRGDRANHTRGRGTVVEEVTHVVRGDPEHREADRCRVGPHVRDRASSATPMRPASLPSCARTMRASGR